MSRVGGTKGPGPHASEQADPLFFPPLRQTKYSMRSGVGLGGPQCFREPLSLPPIELDKWAFLSGDSGAALRTLAGARNSDVAVPVNFSMGLEALVTESRRVAGDAMGTLVERLAKRLAPAPPRYALLDIIGAATRVAVGTGCDVTDVDAMFDRVLDIHASCGLTTMQGIALLEFALARVSYLQPPFDKMAFEQALAGAIHVFDAPAASYDANVITTGLDATLMIGALPGETELRHIGGELEKMVVRRRFIATDLGFARDQGVKLVTSLVEEMSPGFEAAAASLGMRVQHCPTVDFSVPPMGAAMAAVGEIIKALAAKEGVLIHCRAGRGRSGTLAACLLAALGVEPGRAIQAVREARCGAIETEEQIDFVYVFAQEWKVMS